MSRTISLFVDHDIYKLLEKTVRQNPALDCWLLENAKSFPDCFDKISGIHADAAIIQLQTSSDIGACMDFMSSLDSLDYIPLLLIFEKRQGNQIIYTTTDASLKPETTVLSKLFEQATEKKYQPEFTFFRHAEADEDANVLRREEGLEEILRGCSYQETSEYIKEFNLDLRGNGYYLFFWELQSAEYLYHYYNKNVYNMMGSILGKRFVEIINQFEGGEKIRLSLNRFCFIINALTTSSEAAKHAEYERMIQQLSSSGVSKTSSSYISGYVDKIENLRIARDHYEENKSKAFFYKYDGILRAETFQNLKPLTPADIEAAMPSLGKIKDYIHYDCQNPALIKEAKKLYLDIIKPSMSFTLYFYCVASICSSLVQKDKKLDASILLDNLSPEAIRFSSIEEQFDVLQNYIRIIRESSKNSNRNYNTIIMDAIQFIDENYDKDITVPEVAQMLHVSPTYLSQIFRKYMGVSVIKYIIRLRIDKAKTLLETTSNPVYMIADMVGFRDIKHFSKTFKSIIGESPSEYRKSYLNNKPLKR